MALVLPTIQELVDAAAATYAPDAVPAFEDFGRAVRVFRTRRADGLNILAIEGTHDPLGWALDFLALPITEQQTMNHDRLGPIHAGFFESALHVLARCALVAAEGPYAITGHSLGAALALLIGALLAGLQFKGQNLAPVKIGAFAPPRVGGPDFVAAIAAIPRDAVWFGNDPVPLVPDWDPYMQVPNILHLGSPLELESGWRNLARNALHARLQDHHMPNYSAAVHALAVAA